MSNFDFSQLDFDGLKQHLIDYIKEDDTFLDYNFDGSALNSIANLLTYTMLNINFYLNMTTQELYLDSATLYRNVIAIAKSLNYTPYRRQAAYTTLNFSLPEKLTGSVEIPLHCLFEINDVKFVTKTAYNVILQTPIEIELHQLEIIEESKVFDGSSIELLFGEEIANDYLIVKINGVVWDLYDSTQTVGSTSEIYFANINYKDKLEIVFGNNVFGKAPTTGDTIEILYGVTEGSAGNNLNDVKLAQVITDEINNYTDSDAVYENIVLTFNGSDKETIESIKLNAPKFYESQNRAVTENDYRVLIESLSYVGLSNIWSGTENTPAVYGSVFIAATPSTEELYLTTQQKSDLYDYIKQYAPLSIRIEVRDPFYIYVDIDSTVYYYNKYGVSTTSLRTTIENNITNFFSSDINIFNTKLKYSNLVKTIDIPNEISNNLTDLTMFIKFDQSPNNQYNFNLRNVIKEGSLVNDYVYDSGGNILDIINDSTLGTINYSTGVISFSKVLDAIDNVIKFNTEEFDVEFLQDNLPKLNNINITFEGI